VRAASLTGTVSPLRSIFPSRCQCLKPALSNLSIFFGFTFFFFLFFFVFFVFVVWLHFVMLLASQVLMFLRDRFFSPYRHCLSLPLSHSPSFYSLSLTLILPIPGLVSRHLYDGQCHRWIHSAHVWIRHELSELPRARRVLFGYECVFGHPNLSDFFHHHFFTQIIRPICLHHHSHPHVFKQPFS
jgi:hypothetical protein